VGLTLVTTAMKFGLGAEIQSPTSVYYYFRNYLYDFIINIYTGWIADAIPACHPINNVKNINDYICK